VNNSKFKIQNSKLFSFDAKFVSLNNLCRNVYSLERGVL